MAEWQKEEEFNDRLKSVASWQAGAGSAGGGRL